MRSQRARRWWSRPPVGNPKGSSSFKLLQPSEHTRYPEFSGSPRNAPSSSSGHRPSRTLSPWVGALTHLQQLARVGAKGRLCSRAGESLDELRARVGIRTQSKRPTVAHDLEALGTVNRTEQLLVDHICPATECLRWPAAQVWSVRQMEKLLGLIFLVDDDYESHCASRREPGGRPRSSEARSRSIWARNVSP